MNSKEFEEILETLNWEPEKAARKLGVTERTVENWVNSKHKINKTVQILIEIYKKRHLKMLKKKKTQS